MDAHPEVKNTTWWITSLAISVVCCAILFVVFAGYLVEVKENMAVSKLRFDMIEERLHEVSSDLETLRHHSVQQIQFIPANVPAVAIPQAVPESLPVQAAPSPATTVAPPATLPTTVPEVPAKP